ncbi:MAG: SulP family inorganic anion transporter [Rubrivivax sp.]
MLAAAVSRCTVAMASPSSATALTLAALVLRLVQDPQLAAMVAAQPSEAARWVGVAAACAVAGMGLLQLALAALGLARLAHYVPQPVLAGFVNGIALLIVLAQVPLLLGAGPGAPAAQWWPALQQGGSGPLWLGLGTAAGIALVMRLKPRWPALLVGMAGGIAAALALAALWPALSLGNAVSAVSAALPAGPAWMLVGDPAIGAFVARHASAVALTALLLAMIGSLESMLTIVSGEQGSGRRIAADRELAALGLANVIGGFLGALPAVMLRAGTVAIRQAGGRGPLAALSVAVTAAALFVFAGPALAWVPQAVLAGVMVMVGYLIADRWSGLLARRWWNAARRGTLAEGDDTLAGLAVMAVVCALTALLGVAAGVAVGVALSLLVFVRRLNRTLVRTQTSGMARPSRRIYPGAIEARLLGLRVHIALLELEGPLFFGSGAQLPERIEALAPPVRFVIFDLRRVSTVDESGAMLLHEVSERLAARGQELLLAGVVQGGTVARPACLRAVAGAPRAAHLHRHRPRDGSGRSGAAGRSSARRRGTRSTAGHRTRAAAGGVLAGARPVGARAAHRRRGDGAARTAPRRRGVPPRRQRRSAVRRDARLGERGGHRAWASQPACSASRAWARARCSARWHCSTRPAAAPTPWPTTQRACRCSRSKRWSG